MSAPRLRTTLLHEEVFKLCDAGHSVILFGGVGTGKTEGFLEWLLRQHKKGVVLNCSEDLGLQAILMGEKELKADEVLIFDEANRLTNETFAQLIAHINTTGKQSFLTANTVGCTASKLELDYQNVRKFVFPPNHNAYCEIEGAQGQAAALGHSEEMGLKVLMVMKALKELVPMEDRGHVDTGLRFIGSALVAKDPLKAVLEQLAGATRHDIFIAAVRSLTGCQTAELPSDNLGWLRLAVQQATAKRVGVLVLGKESADDKLKAIQALAKENKATVVEPLGPTADFIADEKGAEALAAVLRPGNDHNWIVLRSPHCPSVNLEALNTVLDGNAKLCLCSGEIVKLGDNDRVFVIAEDCDMASPAFVSRMRVVMFK